MRDDHVQGILFEQSAVLDLVKLPARKRLARKVSHTTHRLYTLLPAHRPAATERGETTTYVFSAQEMLTQQQELQEFLDRFKIES